MLKSLLIVGAGSFIGGAARYAISMLMKNCLSSSFPWGTLTVNLLGCLVFGITFALFSKHGSTHSAWCLLLTTGLCGGFTTFSTFSHEAFHMMQSGQYFSLTCYIASSLVFGLLLMALGYHIVK